MISNVDFKNQYGISYAYLHELLRIRLMQKIPLVCTFCGSTDCVELANLNDHVYSTDISDYTFLCRKCHIAFDGRLNNLKQGEKAIMEYDPNATERRCVRCHVVKPVALISCNGSYCKDCDNQIHKERLRRSGNCSVLKLRGDIARGVRTCKDCGYEKPLENFVKNGKFVRTLCKPCYRTYRNGINAANKERVDTRCY